MTEFKRGDWVRVDIGEGLSLPGDVTAAKSKEHPGKVRVRYYLPAPFQYWTSVWVDPERLTKVERKETI